MGIIEYQREVSSIFFSSFSFLCFKKLPQLLKHSTYNRNFVSSNTKVDMPAKEANKFTTALMEMWSNSSPFNYWFARPLEDAAFSNAFNLLASMRAFCSAEIKLLVSSDALLITEDGFCAPSLRVVAVISTLCMESEFCTNIRYRIPGNIINCFNFNCHTSYNLNERQLLIIG